MDEPNLDDEFEFLLTYQKSDENGQVITKAEPFKLKHNDVQTFTVPLETEITIKEIHHDGYHVQIMNEKGENIYQDTITIRTPDKDNVKEEEMEVVFYNSPGVELPSTGGNGTYIYSILGRLLMLEAAMFLWMHR